MAWARLATKPVMARHGLFNLLGLISSQYIQIYNQQILSDDTSLEQGGLKSGESLVVLDMPELPTLTEPITTPVRHQLLLESFMQWHKQHVHGL